MELNRNKILSTLGRSTRSLTKLYLKDANLRRVIASDIPLMSADWEICWGKGGIHLKMHPKEAVQHFGEYARSLSLEDVHVMPTAH